jgi:hypothetical protein
MSVHDVSSPQKSTVVVVWQNYAVSIPLEATKRIYLTIVFAATSQFTGRHHFPEISQFDETFFS